MAVVGRRVDCITDTKARATNLWSDADCGHGQINNHNYNTCVNAAKAMICKDNVLQQIAAFTDCNASAVCTDKAR